MYETKTGTKLAIPNSVFGTLFVGLLLNWTVAGAAALSVGAMWLLVTEVQSGWLISTYGWSLGITKVFFSVSLVAHCMGWFTAARIGLGSGVSTESWIREFLKSRWMVASMCWNGAMIALLAVHKYLDTSIWSGALYVAVCTFLLAAACVGLVVSGQELQRKSRVAAGTPLILDGVDAGYTARKVDTVGRAWSSVGQDWTAPQSIITLETALRYADLARSRSVSTYYAGRLLSLIFGSLTVLALVWSFDIELHPTAVAVPIGTAVFSVTGFAMERRSPELKALHEQYADRARELAREVDSAPDYVQRPTLWRRVAGTRMGSGLIRS